MGNTFRIISKRKIYSLDVALCVTRFGEKVWMITNETLFGPDDHGGVYQGDRVGAIAFVRAWAASAAPSILQRVPSRK